MVITDILSGDFLEKAYPFIKIIVVIAVIIFSIKLTNRFTLSYLKKIRDKNLINETIFQLSKHIVVALLNFIGFILIVSSIPPLQSVAVALVTGAGLVGIVLGLAAQNALGNIVSGISLAIFQPFRVGDFVTVHNEYGKITDLGLRHTVVTTWDNRRLIIPNSIISDEAIINWSIEDPTIMWPVDIGISYDSDINLARSIMTDEAKNHSNVMKLEEIRAFHPEVTEGSEIKVLTTELGDFAVNMKMLVWVKDRSLAFLTGCELQESIKKRFDHEGVEIPFPYRTLVYKKDLGPNIILDTEKTEVPTGGEEHFQDTQDQDTNNQ